MTPDHLLSIWSYLLSSTEDIDRLARRMRVDLELWDTFRSVREDCLEMWIEAKNVGAEFTIVDTNAGKMEETV